MARQNIDYTTSALNPPNAPVDDDLDTGTTTDDAVRPIADGEPAQGAVFKRPSENLRTRTEIIREELNQLKFMSDADKAMLLTSTGDITWNGVGTGTFVPTQPLILKPFLAPDSSTMSRLVICAITQAQITIRTKVTGITGQRRAYNGANDITIDFQPVSVGTGAIIVTTTGDGNRVHVQYDSNAVTYTTAAADSLTGFCQQFNLSAVAVSLGLEAVYEGNGTPPEVGFPTPPSFVAASKLDTYISAPEKATRYMSGATDAEKHIIPAGNFATFFSADGGTLNKLIEGDVLCVWYDALVDDPPSTYGGRRQSLSEPPESPSSTIPAASLFLLRRFPARLPGALPIATVINGQLIFISGRVFNVGETGPLVSSGASYQGSTPNAWADATTIAAGTFESAVDAIVAALGPYTGTTGAHKIGMQVITGPGPATFSTPAGPLDTVIVNTVNEMNTKAGLALANTFTQNNIFTTATVNGTSITANGDGTGSGVTGNSGTTAGARVGVRGVTQAEGGIGVRGSVLGSVVDGTGVTGVGKGVGCGVDGSAPTIGVKGAGTGGNGFGVDGTGGGSGSGVKGTGGAAGQGGQFEAGGGTAVGVSGQGSTTGAGVSGMGGASSGPGVDGLGGGPNGSGVKGTGTGTGAGLLGLSSGASSPTIASEGVFGQGTAATTGVKGVGGATGGTGVEGRGGLTSGNSKGVEGFGGPGTTGGIGVSGEGGAGGGGPGTGGTGVRGKGGTPNGVGGLFEGVGTGDGIKATAPGSGVGVRAESSGSSAAVSGLALGTGPGGNFQASSGNAVAASATTGGDGVSAFGRYGVLGMGSDAYAGVRGEGGGTTSVGVSGVGAVGGGAGVKGEGNVATDAVGVLGIGSGTEPGLLGQGGTSNGHGVFSQPSGAGKGFVVNGTTAVPLAYSGTRAHAAHIDALQYKWVLSSGTTLRYFPPGSGSTAIALGAGASTTIQMWTSFRLPLGALITDVTAILTHAGSTGGAAAASMMVRKYAINVDGTPYTSAKVLSGAPATQALVLDTAAHVGEFVPTSLTGTTADKTVNTIYEFFGVELVLVGGAGGYCDTNLVAVSYNHSDIVPNTI